MKAIVKKIKQETYDTKIFSLELEKELKFKPGQFIMLKLKDLPKRAYSISSIPDGKKIELTIKIYEEGLVTPHIDKLKENNPVEIDGPYGTFFLDENDKKVTFLAAGTGIAAFMSMVRYIKEKKLDIKFKLMYSSRTTKDIIFKDELGDVIHTITRDPDYSGFKGRITKKFIREQCDLDSTFYICGLPHFVKDMVEKLKEIGIKKIKKEVY